MAYIREFTSFRSNIVRLKNYVNKNYQSDKDNELYLIMFNSTINNYPNKNWSSIENDFFEKIPKDDINLTLIFTILSYKLGNSFLALPEIIQKDLIDALIINKINAYKFAKHATFLTCDELLKLTIYGFEHHLIKPRHIYKIIYDNFDLTNLDAHKLEDILTMINKFIKEHEIKIFNGNYYFFNIYRCLRKLITLEFYPDDTSVIELIPLFNTIPDEELKQRIQKDFENIENSDKPLIEKIEDAIIVAHHYSYDLPLAQKKRDK